VSSSSRSASERVSLKIVQPETPAQIGEAGKLFTEYASSLGFSLCFQGFDKELAELPGGYSPPDGRLLLAYSEQSSGQETAGCVALHKLEPGICEMKRLFVRPAFRGKGIGKMLAEAIIAEARGIGYRSMRLDTVQPIMKEAVKMYRVLGFREISPYCVNPIAGALYMELQL
jgi:ribosomal protein S18 acetylase RimI-like enzyme